MVDAEFDPLRAEAHADQRVRHINNPMGQVNRLCVAVAAPLSPR